MEATMKILRWHWLEAQLKYCGLKASKVKAVAHVILHDAARHGNLIVPTEINQLEAAFAEESKNKERGHYYVCVCVCVFMAGGKRNIDVVDGGESVQRPVASNAASKKAMAAPVEDVMDVEDTPAPAPRNKQTARRGTQPYTEYAAQENFNEELPPLGLLNGDYTLSWISGNWGYEEIDLS
ncbi:hypothetical protein N7495_005722 [Penicillium taxi]|uniref:uncharacterized protein n=1 Tax=Penicillium taxi TaxID=168475 RepID=UPI00254577D2|nr:uncharacterized protein N7495_005722 [Penicillium taxi]KAJ5894031.1 hypothetical protein N7495_005722 [Penicillium taxi]